MYGAAMGITVESVTIDLEGDIDLQGMLMLPEPGKVRPGFQEIRATYNVKSDAPRDQLEKLAKTNPVLRLQLAMRPETEDEKLLRENQIHSFYY
jgi:hypothetical protein